MARHVEKELGRRIAAYRQGGGLTQEELAERVRVASETISRLERGITVPSLKTLEMIATALGVELRDLFDFGALRAVRTQPLNALLRELQNRTPEEIAYVHDVARRFFRFVDGRGGRRRGRLQRGS